MIPLLPIALSPLATWEYTEYASVDAVSPDDALMLSIAVDHVVLRSSSGPFLADLVLDSSSEPRWISPMTVLFGRGNQLLQFNVMTRVVEEVATFSQYTTISGKGESNLGQGAIALCGDNSDIFIFDLVNRTSSRAFKHPLPFDSLYMTPDNNLLVSDDAGITLFSKDMTALRVVTAHNGHKDVCRDVDGSEILVWTDNRDNAIYKYPLDGRPPLKLLDLPWPVAVDISCPAQSGWCIVSTYSLSSSYPGQVLKVALDGSGSELLALHGSVQIPGPGGVGMEYNPQPKATVSASGRILLGSSNFGQTADPDFCQLWLMRLDGQPAAIFDTRINYAPYVAKDQFLLRPRGDLVLTPRPDGGCDLAGIVDLYTRKA